MVGFSVSHNYGHEYIDTVIILQLMYSYSHCFKLTNYNSLPTISCILYQYSFDVNGLSEINKTSKILQYLFKMGYILL